MNIDINVIAAVNNEDVLNRNLFNTNFIFNNIKLLHLYRNKLSASIAYNEGIFDSKSEYIVFVHQDVYLPETWTDKLEAAVETLNAQDPNWAILGSIGITGAGCHVGRVWSSGLGAEVGVSPEQPVRIESLDELVLVMRRDKNLKFDEALPGFHLYGTDIVQTAKLRGLNSYAADLPVVHNSQPIRTLGGDYAAAHKYMRHKWKDELPVQNLVAPLISSPLPLLRARARTFWTRNKRFQRAVSSTTNPKEIAARLGYE